MPVNIKGKMYTTIVERLAAAHGEDIPVKIARVETKFEQFGDSVLARAIVTFDDNRNFQGTAEVNVDATSGVDATSAFENGETSAVGRALANAGYPGSDDGLAGAEEMQHAQRGGRQRPTVPPRANGAPKGQAGPSTADLRTKAVALEGQAKAAGIDYEPLKVGAARDEIIQQGKQLKAKLEAPADLGEPPPDLQPEEPYDEPVEDPTPPRRTASPDKPVSEKQMNFIKSLCEQKGEERETWLIPEMNAAEASEAIEALMAMPDAGF